MFFFFLCWLLKKLCCLRVVQSVYHLFSVFSPRPIFFFQQKSKQDIDKPKVQSLEDILKSLDEEEVDEDEQEAERRMEELLAGELVSLGCITAPPKFVFVSPVTHSYVRLWHGVVSW